MHLTKGSTLSTSLNLILLTQTYSEAMNKLEVWYSEPGPICYSDVCGIQIL